MKQYNTESKKSNIVMEGSEGKGVQMYKTPYLWRENNPVHPYADTPCENFVPTPTMDSGEEDLSHFKVKKAIAIGLVVLLVGFMIYALIAQILENPQIFGLGEIAKRQFF